jgi:hypothetical protein
MLLNPWTNTVHSKNSATIAVFLSTELLTNLQWNISMNAPSSEVPNTKAYIAVRHYYITCRA